MRYITTATVFLLLAMVPGWAQMRGARGGGAAVSRGSASAGVRMAPSFNANVSGPRFYTGAVRSNAIHSNAIRSNAIHSNVVVRSEAPMRRWSRGTGFGFGYGSRPYHRRYGYSPYGYPYYAYPYAYVGAYPYYGYDDSGVYSSYSTNSDSDYYQQQQLNAEIGSLNQQIEDLREQNDSLRDYVTSSNPQTGAVPQQQTDRRIPQSLQQPMQSAVAPAPATVLVFRDGHMAEVGNYAIVGKTLWALSARRSQKYPLADIDVAKTQQENEKRGVEFTAPVE